MKVWSNGLKFKLWSFHIYIFQKIPGEQRFEDIMHFGPPYWTTSFNYWKTSCWMHSLTFKRNSRQVDSWNVQAVRRGASKCVAMKFQIVSKCHNRRRRREKKEVFLKLFFLVRCSWWKQLRRERFRSCTQENSVRIRVSLW